VLDCGGFSKHVRGRGNEFPKYSLLILAIWKRTGRQVDNPRCLKFEIYFVHGDFSTDKGSNERILCIYRDDVP
jgi:hypothetical protein